MVRYLYAASLLHGVVVEVDIAAFVEAVVRGLVGRCGRREVVVYVCKAMHTSVTVHWWVQRHGLLTGSEDTLLPVVAACLLSLSVSAAPR